MQRNKMHTPIFLLVNYSLVSDDTEEKNAEVHD